MFVGGEREGKGKGRCRRKCKRDWRWRTSGKVDWERRQQKVEETMDQFAKDMETDTESGWTARGRYKVFRSYLNEAAGES